MFTAVYARSCVSVNKVIFRGIVKHSFASHTQMERPVVDIEPGSSVRGKIVYANDSPNPVLTYLGVPFAEPPIGARRFKPPEPLQIWKGVRDATAYGPICPQPLEAAKIAFSRYPVPEKMSEDCLYLNIFTPVNQSQTSGESSSLPVMVWIHGGGFLLGSSDIYDGRALAAHHNVIVVSINYRLGIFGYLWTPDGHISGNMGQLDQIEALRWVQRYIHKFGGDKDNVTIFGESAGAFSVSLHTVSPLGRGLFRRAICESGMVMTPSVVWSHKNATKFLRSALKPHGCDSVDGKTVEAFLNKMSTEEITQKFFKGFGRVVDGYYLPAHPIELYRANSFHPVDLLCGFNTHEGLLIISMFVGPSAISSREEAEIFIKMSLRQVHYRGHPHADEIGERAAEFYLSDIKDDDSARFAEMSTQVHADNLFTAPTILTATQHSTKARTFVYEFNHRPFFSRHPDWLISDHTDEIPYVFGEPSISPRTWPGADKEVSQIVMKYWTNFAKTGDPSDPILPKWPQYSQESKAYIKLQQRPQVAKDYKPRVMEFWNKTVLDISMSATNDSKL